MRPRQVAFPYLYNNRPRKVRLSAYHHPMVMYIKMEDPDLPAFYYDPLIHPIAFYKASADAAAGADALDDDEEDAFVLPEGGPLSLFWLAADGPATDPPVSRLWLRVALSACALWSCMLVVFCRQWHRQWRA